MAARRQLVNADESVQELAFLVGYLRRCDSRDETTMRRRIEYEAEHLVVKLGDQPQGIFDGKGRPRVTDYLREAWWDLPWHDRDSDPPDKGQINRLARWLDFYRTQSRVPTERLLFPAHRGRVSRRMN